MKNVTRAVRTLMLAALICVLLVTAVSAASEGSVWLNTTETSEDTAVFVVTDTMVTDGLVEISYDSTKLTYEEVKVNEDRVAMYAVNADTAGTVKISLVAPEAYETDGSGIWLIQVCFSGTEEKSSVALTGAVNDAEGNAVALAENLDTSEPGKAVQKAEELDAGKYTEESYAAVQEALKEAEAVLADPAATQAEVDAAAKALNDAIAALVPVSNQPADDDKDSGDNADTGDSSMIGLAVCLAAASAAGIAIVSVVDKRRHVR